MLLALLAKKLGAMTSRTRNPRTGAGAFIPAPPTAGSAALMQPLAADQLRTLSKDDSWELMREVLADNGRFQPEGMAIVLDATKLPPEEIKQIFEQIKQVLASVEASKTIPSSPSEEHWGPAPSRQEAGHAANTIRLQAFKDRGELVKRSLTRSEVAGMLDISPQAVTNRLDKGKLLGLQRKREWQIPAWQLDSEATDGVLPGLAALQAAFPGGLVQLSKWVEKPHVDLDGGTPRDAWAAGRTDEVLHLVGTITAKGW